MKFPILASTTGQTAIGAGQVVGYTKGEHNAAKARTEVIKTALATPESNSTATVEINI
jgi:hypothetical protein